jgi:hypothetical protein
MIRSVTACRTSRRPPERRDAWGHSRSPAVGGSSGGTGGTPVAAGGRAAAEADVPRRAKAPEDRVMATPFCGTCRGGGRRKTCCRSRLDADRARAQREGPGPGRRPQPSAARTGRARGRSLYPGAGSDPRHESVQRRHDRGSTPPRRRPHTAASACELPRASHAASRSPSMRVPACQRRTWRGGSSPPRGADGSDLSAHAPSLCTRAHDKRRRHLARPACERAPRATTPNARRSKSEADRKKKRKRAPKRPARPRSDEAALGHRRRPGFPRPRSGRAPARRCARAPPSAHP